MKKIRIILIDAKNKEVKAMEIEPTLEEYYRLIGCELIEAVHPKGLAPKHHLYVDEEGLYRQTCSFLITGFPAPLRGNAILLSHDDEGESASCTISVGEISNMVYF